MQESTLQRVEMHMGTAVIISVPGELEDLADANVAVDLCFARARAIDDTFSVYKSDSVISRFGRGEIREDDLASEVREILDLCEKLHASTEGAFDIYAAGRLSPACELQASVKPGARPIDPSGAVKGWAIQECVDIMHDADIKNFCINIGGDIFAAGYESPDLPWKVGLQHPVEHDKIMATLHLCDMAVATSGFYERGEHIVGTNAHSTHELLSVSVVGADITLADAYATSAFAMGRSGVDWIAEQSGFDVFAVTHTLEVLSSPGINDFREQ